MNVGSTQHNYCSTELGVGEHDAQEMKLHGQRHREFQEHLTEASQTVPSHFDREEENEDQTAERQLSSSSAACIGWSQSDDYVEKKKRLNLERKAEYEAHLAKKANEKRESQADQYHEPEARGVHMNDLFTEVDIRRQKQSEYARELHEQIAEKRALNSNRRMSVGSEEAKEEKDVEDSQDSSQWDGGEISEADIRHKNQTQYAKELHDQIAEKRRLDLARKQREDREDEVWRN